MNWYTPNDPTPREQCPCCGYVSLPERGTCQICPVCFWEDDPFTQGAHRVYSVNNHMTLAAARESFLAIGAVEERLLEHALPAHERARFERRALDPVDPHPPTEQCPCCGYVTLPERHANYDCAVCHWTDVAPTESAPQPMDMALTRARFAAREASSSPAAFERRPLDTSAPLVTEACPCCDFVTLSARAGQVCGICYWVDDIGDVLDVHSLAAGVTLATARANFIAIGAAFEEAAEWVIDPSEHVYFERRSR